jgi:hypothetical protein
MTTHRHHLNLLGVAFLAIVWMSSVGAPANASAEVTMPKACCAASPAANCRCCGLSESSAPLSGAARSEGVKWSVPSAAMRLEAPRAASCECRADAPAAPAPKPDSRSTDESRTHQSQDEVIAYLAFAPRAFVPAFRFDSANMSPPKSPLYLRTLHLLV